MGDLAQFDQQLGKLERELVPGAAHELKRECLKADLGKPYKFGDRRGQHRGVLFRTPKVTKETVRAWSVSVGSTPRFGQGVRLPPPGTTGTLHLANDADWILVLEFGGYPNPPKRGSWSKRLGRYVVRSVNGFSKFAPRGIARITHRETLSALRAAGFSVIGGSA